MHDIRFIREHPEVFDHALHRRGMHAQAAAIMRLDAERRASQTSAQELLAKRNALSKEIGAIKGKGGNADAQMQEVAAIKDKIAALEAQEQEFAAKLNDILSGLPNIPAQDVPDGKDEKDNKELRRSGEPKRINSVKEHFDIGEALGYMDFETAAKLSGARFTILKGPLARLERALINFMLDINTNEFGYQEVSPPLLVRDEIMYGTGQLPKFKDDQFAIERMDLNYARRLAEAWVDFSDPKDGTHLDLSELIKKYSPRVRDAYLTYRQEEEPTSKLYALERLAQEVIAGKDDTQSRLWLIPTAEVPLTNLVNDTIINREELPYRFTAKTPCFRAEAGAAGKDTRGMLRQHQFYKVEMVSITTPDKSEEEHERMTSCAETILKRLELPFRTVLLCSGDMGFGARKTYDIEVWMPGQNTYREISSCSNCGDFQARRMNARSKAAGEKSIEFVHTLNGSGVAVGRCLIAIMENFQESDGSVTIPAALRPYMGGMERIEAAVK